MSRRQSEGEKGPLPPAYHRYADCHEAQVAFRGTTQFPNICGKRNYEMKIRFWFKRKSVLGGAGR